VVGFGPTCFALPPKAVARPWACNRRGLSELRIEYFCELHTGCVVQLRNVAAVQRLCIWQSTVQLWREQLCYADVCEGELSYHAAYQR